MDYYAAYSKVTILSKLAELVKKVPNRGLQKKLSGKSVWVTFSHIPFWKTIKVLDNGGPRFESPLQRTIETMSEIGLSHIERYCGPPERTSRGQFPPAPRNRNRLIGVGTANLDI
jgi:hypothetical protein